MKTNTGHYLESRILREITAESVADQSSSAFHQGDASSGKTPAWWSEIVITTRKTYVAMNASLVAYYRLLLGSAESAVRPDSPRGTALSLRADEVKRITRRDASRIEVQHGVVWLTASPSTGDVLLRAGDHFDVRDDSLHVLQALAGPATILSKRDS